jgi:hypothetical protein
MSRETAWVVLAWQGGFLTGAGSAVPSGGAPFVVGGVVVSGAIAFALFFLRNRNKEQSND